MIVEDWKIGTKVNKGKAILTNREEIANLVKNFMDLESDEGKEMRKGLKNSRKFPA